MSALYVDDLVELHHGDCREVLPRVVTGPADLAVVDPPYGDTSLDWDNRPGLEWLDVVDNLLAPTGTVWLWGSLRSLLTTLPAAEAVGWKVSQDVVWEKHNGSSSAADRFRRVHEHAVLLYRGNWADTYHDVQTSADAVPRRVHRRQRPRHWGEIGEAAYVSEDGGPRLMRSVMFERSTHGRAVHPTQKPEGITRTLIQYACPPGGLVLDPYAGSATTLVAARACGRRAIGVELDHEHATAAAERLAAAPLPLEAS